MSALILPRRRLLATPGLVIPRDCRPVINRLRPQGFGVRYQTALCDRRGRVERVLQSGTNMITDWGMDQLASNRCDQLTTHLHLGSTAVGLKRLLQNDNEITVDPSDPAAVEVVADSNFFESNDVGRTLKIAGWPELEITSYADERNVTGKARGSAWLPGFTPPGAGPFTDVGVHYTNVNALAAQFTTFNTLDTGSPNNNTELTDSANSRFIRQKIWLSSVVSGSPWTVNQLGWGQGSTNVFGKTTLAGPDTVPVDKRYRVHLQIYLVYTPLDLNAVTIDWGGSIGSYEVDIRQERVALDRTAGSDTQAQNIFRPLSGSTTSDTFGYFLTSAQTRQSIQWQGDVGFSPTIHNIGSASAPGATANIDSSYSAGTHRRTRAIRWGEGLGITNATMLGVAGSFTGSNRYLNGLGIFPTSGTISKPSGWRADLIFPIHWTRQLIN